jgi:preprotein translocase subunit YajC
MLMAFLHSDAWAMGQPAGGQGQSSALGLFVPLLLMFVVLYFFMIRPAQKRQKEKERMLGALKKGDRIVTSGGIHGEILQVKDQSLVVRIAENVKVELQRGSVSSVIPEEAGEKGSS